MSVLRRLRSRLRDLREVAEYVAPHLRRERLEVATGTGLAFLAAALFALSTLLMASVLDVVRSGSSAVPVGSTIDWSKLLDLNTAGAEMTSAVWWAVGEGRDTRGVIVVLGLGIIVATAGGVLSNIASRWLWLNVRNRVIAEMQVDLFAHLLSLPLAFHVTHRSGGLLSRLHTDVSGVAWMLPVIFHTLLRAPFVVGASLLAMVRTSIPLTAITLFAAVAYLVVNLVLGRFVRQSFITQSTGRAGLMSLAQEALQAIRVVKAFGAERIEVAEMRSQLGPLMREYVRGDLLSSHIPTALNQVLTAAAAITVALAGLELVARGQLTVAGLVLFLVASIALLVTSAVAAEAMLSIYMLSASAARVLELWNVRSAMIEGSELASGLTHSLALEDVSFRYGDAPVLERITLRIARGQVIGIVGASGSGKTTLVDLVLRLYDPTSGSVELDGVDVRRFTQESYRRLFGVVPQESLLFNDTVARNIAYGRADVTRADIEAAARIANAHGFITRLPEGYDTNVGERGTRLSGGERQRVAIARAIVSRPPVLVFDEATSALDNESERLVQDAIDGAIAGRTAIIIAHRISTIQNADRIIVIDGARVAEEGTHRELLHMGGLYRRFYEAGTIGTGPETVLASSQPAL